MVIVKKFTFQNGVRLSLYPKDSKFDGILSLPKGTNEYQFVDWKKERISKIMHQLGRLTLDEVELAFAYYRYSSKGFRTCLKWALHDDSRAKMKKAVGQGEFLDSVNKK